MWQKNCFPLNMFVSLTEKAAFSNVYYAKHSPPHLESKALLSLIYGTR